MLKVYHYEDESLVEYYSHGESDFDNLHKKSRNVLEYAKFYNRHYDVVSELEEKVTKHGHPNMLINDNDVTDNLDIENQIEGINLMQLFSLAKKSPIPIRHKEENTELSDCEN